MTFECDGPEARRALMRHLAARHRETFAARYAELAPRGAYTTAPEDVARRRLRNLCLSYLIELEGNIGGSEALTLARQQYENADNMTDQFAALSVLANTDAEVGQAVLDDFYARWQGEALVVDKWLAVQSSGRLAATLARVERLTAHPAFDIKNPNKVYALIRTFGANHRHFHAADGAGYRFLAAQIAQLDPINPQVAARLARCFDRWRRFDSEHQRHAKAALESLRQLPALSPDVFEVVDKALG